MKTTYSRRELYALGEPIGNSATYTKVGGGRVYGGGGGSWNPVTIIEDAVSSVGDAVGDVFSGIGDAVEGVVEGVGDALAGLDNVVRDVIPGGWVGVGALTLMACGIYDPELLAMAEEGTLTGEAISGAGYDVAAVSSDISTLGSEYAAAGFDSVEAYSEALNAGFSNASEYANATLNGFTNAADYTAATNAGFANAAEYSTATNLGFSNAATYDAAMNAGFTNAAEYTTATNAGFVNAAEYQVATDLGYTNAGEFFAGESGGFANAADYQVAASHGFDTQAGFQAAAENAGFTNTATYNTALNAGFTEAAEYQAATDLGYSTYGEYAAGTDAGFANAAEFRTASDLGYANASQYQVGLQGGYANADAMFEAMTEAGFSSPESFGAAMTAGFAPGIGATAADYFTSLAAGIPDYAKYAAAVAAGLIIPNLVKPIQPGTTHFGYAGQSPWTWGSAEAPINPGMNPGLISGQIGPHYDTTSPDQAQYYWGQHQPITSGQNINQQWNNLPNAPAEPWGTPTSAVGGTEHLDIPKFVQSTIQQPEYQAGFGGPVQPVNPVEAPAFNIPQEYMTGETIPIAPVATTFGGPGLSPFQYIPAELQTTTGLVGGAPNGIPARP